MMWSLRRTKKRRYTLLVVMMMMVMMHMWMLLCRRHTKFHIPIISTTMRLWITEHLGLWW